MKNKVYASLGGFFTNRLEFSNGKVVAPVMGGAAVYALSAFLFGTENSLIISGAGKDIDKYYGSWLERNNVSREGIIYKTDINEYSYVRYNLDGTYECGSTYGKDFRNNYLKKIKLSFDEVEPILKKISGLYHCGDWSNSDFRKIDNIRNENGLKIMWEMSTELTTNIASVKENLKLCDIWSLNKPESFKLFNVKNEESAISCIAKLKKPCFYRVGKKGSYYIDENGESFFAPSVHIVCDDQEIDPTGCGNSSTAAAFWAFNEGYNGIEIPYWANIVAGYTVRQYGPYALINDETRKEIKEKFNTLIKKEINRGKNCE